MNVLIVGGGKVGTYLATMLVAGGHSVKVLEPHPAQIAMMQRVLPAESVVHGSGTDPSLLESTNIRQANVVAAVTGMDETNLVAANLARHEFHVPRIIARVNNPNNAWMFTPEMGVDVALNQADLIAHMIAEEMSLGDMMTLLKLRKGRYSLVEEKVHPDSVAAGKAVRDLHLPVECVLSAVIRKGQLIIPHGDLVLQPVDEVLAVVHASQIGTLASLLGRMS